MNTREIVSVLVVALGALPVLEARALQLVDLSPQGEVARAAGRRQIRSGRVTFNTTGYTLAGGTLTGTAPINAITAGTGVSATIGSVLSGSNAFMKAGAGTVTLTGANTYTGATTVSAGELRLTQQSV